MASASAQTDDIEEEEFQTQIRRAIEIVVSKIHDSLNQPHGQRFSLNSNFDEIIPKIHEILTKLDQLSHGLQGFIDGSSLRSTLASISHVNPADLLQEIESYKKSLERFLPMISRLHTSSKEMFLTLLQMAINGIEIPTIEEFHSPPISLSTLFRRSITDAFQTTIQQTNVTREVIKSLILKLSEYFAISSNILQPLTSVANFLIQLPVSAFMVSIKLSEEEFDLCSRISTLKRQLDSSGIRHRISRVGRYLHLALDENFNIELSSKIRDSFMMVKASVKKCKEQHPGTGDIDIVRDLSTQPVCAGLVQPIVSFLGCSEQEGWEFMLQVFSQVHRT